MSQSQYSFTLWLRVWSPLPSSWQNSSRLRDLLSPSPSSPYPPCACPSSTAPVCAADKTEAQRTLTGGKPSHFRGGCFIPSASSCGCLMLKPAAPLGEAATASRCAGVGWRNCLTRLCCQNAVTMLQRIFLSSCKAACIIHWRSMAWPATFFRWSGHYADLGTKQACLFLAGLPP